ncbi:uncharacterized protein [Rhodnius prolixus]|uniref:uncharacterized protein n=1 Tax=Rhodnius prolixus TaxID=13249 RepID=UPI003D18E185
MEHSKQNILKQLQCPFTWNLADIKLDAPIKSKLDHLLQKNNNVSGQPWINLLLSLATAYEYCINEDASRAFSELDKSITILENEKNDAFLNKYKKSFQHVVYSTKLFVKKDILTNSEFVKETENIPQYSELSAEQKTAVTGIKAHILSEYGVQGSKCALTLVRQALKENPHESEWSFFVGILLGRIRHYSCEQKVTDEELSSMENAYKLNKTPQNAVFMAQTYLDVATSLKTIYSYSEDRKQIIHRGRMNEDFYKNAYNLYKEALNLNEKTHKDLQIKIRCIDGQFKVIKYNGKKRENAIELENLIRAIKECLEVAPDHTYSNHIASKIYFELGDNENGFKHAYISEKNGNFQALMTIIDKKLELKIKFNSEKIFEDALKTYQDEVYLYQTYVLAIAYYIFHQYNIVLMMKYFLMAAECKMDRKHFKRYLFWTRKPVDVCHIACNQVRLTIMNKRYKSEEELKQLKQAVEKFCSLYPDVMKEAVRNDLLQNLKKR